MHKLSMILAPTHALTPLPDSSNRFFPSNRYFSLESLFSLLFVVVVVVVTVLSLQEGPKYKDGPRDDCNDYRPI